MLLSNWKNSGWWSQFFPLQYGLSSHSLWDLTNQRWADLKQADVYSDKLLIVLPGLQHVLWVHKCKLFLLCTAQFLLEMALKASMPWARVRLTCPITQLFVLLSLSTIQGSLFGFRVSWSYPILSTSSYMVLSLGYCAQDVFSLHHTTHLPVHYFYFPPYSLSFCAVSFHPFLCVFDNLCCQLPLPGPLFLRAFLH